LLTKIKFEIGAASVFSSWAPHAAPLQNRDAVCVARIMSGILGADGLAAVVGAGDDFFF
jgi:hypothetical protein